MLAPCWVVVPHVQHLVVLAHVRTRCRPPFSDPAKVAEVDLPKPEFWQHDNVHLVEHASILVQVPNKGTPTWERRGRGEDRRKSISIQDYIYFSTNYCVFWLN